MIRIRNKDGTVQNLDNAMFVEVCDLEGNIGVLLYNSEDSVELVQKHDTQAKRYEELFGTKFVEIKKLK